MSVPRRTRLSLIGAAASGVLVMAMTGTALAAGHEDAPDCSAAVQDAQAALDSAAPSERLHLSDPCTSIPVLNTDDAEDTEDGTPDTTPAAAPDEESAADDSAADDSTDDSADDSADSADSADDEKDSDEKDDKKADDKDGDEDGDEDGGKDRDCADFDSQADAQAAFEESSNDEERLDADDDGVACEDHFGTEDQQVAVHPRGGVATGGAGL